MTKQAGNLSLEAIAFQDKKFGLALEGVFQEILAKRHTGAEIDKLFSPRIGEIIKEFTNLTVVPRFNIGLAELVFCGASPAIMAIGLTPNHIFFRKKNVERSGDPAAVQGYARAIVEHVKENNLKNTVNTRRAWVTGIFAELPMDLSCPTSFIYEYKLTAAEITAVILHEIGHAFTMCEMTNRVSTTNQVLAAMMHAKRHDTLEVQEYVFKEAGTLMGNDEKMFSVTEGIKSDEAVFTVVINAMEKHSHSESFTGHYDVVSCEQMADQFVSRMGYGRALVIALDKAVTTKSDKDPNARHRSQIIDTVMAFLKDGGAMLTWVFFGPLGLLIAGTYTLAMIAFLTRPKGEMYRDHTYDSARVRYLRIREDLLNRIKDKKIPPAQVKEHLNDLKEIDKYVDALLKKESKNYWEIASNFIFKKNKQALDARELQRQLEELASNDLYRAAAQLRINK